MKKMYGLIKIMKRGISEFINNRQLYKDGYLKKETIGEQSLYVRNRMRLVDRRLRHKRRKKLIFFGVPLFIAIFLLVFFKGILTGFGNLYLHVLNPHAGITNYEKEYKKVYTDLKESEKQQIEFINKEMSSKDENAAYILSQYDKIREMFTKAESLHKDRVLIEKKISKLPLSGDYKEFFQNRVDADEEDYKFFESLRLSADDYFSGITSLKEYISALNRLRETAFQMTLKNGLTEENFRKFDEDLMKLETLASAIRKIAEKRGNLPDIMEFTDYNLETMKTARQVNVYLRDKDIKNTEILASGLLKRKKIDSWDINGLFPKWRMEFAVIFSGLLNKGDARKELYNKAFLYAKEKNLVSVLSVWNGGDNPY